MASRTKRTTTRKVTSDLPQPAEEHVSSSSEEETVVSQPKKGRSKKENGKMGRVFRLDQSSLVCEEGPDVTQMDVKDLFSSDYVYPNPCAAAKKAFAKVCRLFTPITKKGEDRKTIDVVTYILTVVEVSNNKHYSYRATRAARTADDISSAEQKRKEKGDDSKPFIQAIYKTTVKAYGQKLPASSQPSHAVVETQPEVVSSPVATKVVAKKTLPPTKKTTAQPLKIIEHPITNETVTSPNVQPPKKTSAPRGGKATSTARGAKAK